MKESPQVQHRKLWEWCFIAQALFERGMLQSGKRGLGFAVGKEPLSDLFAGCDATIVATDLNYEQSHKNGWVDTNQHAAQLSDLNERSLCKPERFDQLVSFRYVDMNRIPQDLQGFDFLWSCCALEHVGSIRKGLRFIMKSMNCLNPGGIAVHTTDFNVNSDKKTIDHAHDVLFRKRDIEKIIRRLSTKGHRVAELDLTTGTGEADRYVSQPPYTQDAVHLKLQVASYIVTSIGLIIQKKM